MPSALVVIFGGVYFSAVNPHHIYNFTYFTYFYYKKNFYFLIYKVLSRRLQKSKTSINKKSLSIWTSFSLINYVSLNDLVLTTQHFNCGLDETRTRDPLRDRQVF